MTAEIITIGDELLIGQVIDSNSAWIAQELNSIGVSISRIVSISDSPVAIQSAIEASLDRVDIVVVTGGLGPTSDDRTKAVMCHIFGGPMVTHAPTLAHIEAMFARRGMALSASNRDQAQIPATCQVLPNAVGTAPGMLFRRDKKLLFSLPGVPFEMQELIRSAVMPILRDQMDTRHFIEHQVIQVFGIAESLLSERLAAFEQQLPPNVSLAYLPSPAGLRLRLSGSGADAASLSAQMQHLSATLESQVHDYFFARGETSLPAVVGALLLQHGQTVASAESCTGGRIAHLLTSIPGASNYYEGSVVSYSNRLKHKILGISPELLQHPGAVSAEVVEQMAQGVRRLLGTTYGVATSGIAGPDGGTPQKPVGLVYIGVASEKQTLSQRYVFGTQRNVNIERASYTALNELRKLIISENQ